MLSQQVHAVRLVPLETILVDISHCCITFPMAGSATGGVTPQARTGVKLRVYSFLWKRLGAFSLLGSGMTWIFWFLRAASLIL